VWYSGVVQLQTLLKGMVATPQKLIHLPGGKTWRWLRFSTIAAGRVGKNIGNPLATGHSLAWWRKLGMVACSTIAAGQVGILATLLQLIKYLPGGGTCSWLRCSTIAVRQVGKNIDNSLEFIKLPGCVVPPLLQDRLG
jgi:hypothetical protein